VGLRQRVIKRIVENLAVRLEGRDTSIPSLFPALFLFALA
jgi:hypothetical protein